MEGATLARVNPAAVGGSVGAANDGTVEIQLVIGKAGDCAAGQDAQLAAGKLVVPALDIFDVQRGRADGDDLGDGIQQGNVRIAAVWILHGKSAFLIDDRALVQGRGVGLYIVLRVVQQRFGLRRLLHGKVCGEADGALHGEGVGRVLRELRLAVIPAVKAVALIRLRVQRDLRAFLHDTGGNAGDRAAFFSGGIDRVPEVDAGIVHQIVGQRRDVLADMQIDEETGAGIAAQILGEGDVSRGVVPAAALILAENGGKVAAISCVLGECAPLAVVEHLNLQVDLAVVVAVVAAEPAVRAEEAAGGILTGCGIEIDAVVREVAAGIDVCGNTEVVLGIAVKLGNVEWDGDPCVVLSQIGREVGTVEVIAAVDHDPHGWTDRGRSDGEGCQHSKNHYECKKSRQKSFHVRCSFLPYFVL